MRLGIDTFSVRFQGWDAFQTLEYAARVGLDVVQFSTRENLDSHDPGYLDEVKAHAGRLGLQLEVGMGSIDRHAASFRPELGTGAEQLADMCRAAARLGSPVVRCFLGMQSDRQGAVPFSEHVAECERTLQEVAPLARELGLKIAIENHGFGDFLAHELKALIERAGPDYAAVTLDTGNPAYAAEDPHYSAEVLAPYVATTHFRDTAIWEDERGAVAQWTILGQGTVDLRAVLAVLQRVCPHVAVDLETITGGAPRLIPYLDPDSEFWKLYPDMPARSLARYVALARKGTRAGAGPLEQLTGQPGPGTAPEQAERLRAQQLEHFERSVAYARDVLGLGERASQGQRASQGGRTVG
ncbi:MAG TPA: sugar phosphate isomerase/epimerase [Chloroflexota bacterium]|nr:sugar phosphate isomerase/epimerase [Chloroflexota bacterium]